MRCSTLAAAALLALLAAVPAGAAPGTGPYTVITKDGTSRAATAVAFAPTEAILVTQGRKERVPLGEIDFYRTFTSNLQSGTTNVVAFTTGALLRFEKLEIENGMVSLVTAAEGTLEVPESLIDFEGSVREGALVRVPEGAGGPVQVSKPIPGGGAGGGATYDEPDQGAGGPISPATRRRGALPGARRLANPRSERVPPEAAGVPQDFEPPPQPAVPDESANEDHSGGNGNGSEGENDGGSPGGIPGPDDQPSPGDSVSVPGETGQTVVDVSTDYIGDVSGLQVRLTYPRTLNIVGAPAFSGFAAALTSSVGTQPGFVNIAGIVPEPSTPVQATGGDFLQVIFSWVGQAPRPTDFALTAIATDADGTNIPGFPARLNVR